MTEILDIEREKAEYRKSLYDKLEGYVAGVTGGTVVCCKKIRKAVNRYVRDRQNPSFYFSTDAVDKFFNYLFYVKILHDKEADQYTRFNPEPWQVFYFANIYGFHWAKNMNKRRFTTSFLTLAKKNGKTTLAVICSMYALTKESRNSKIVIVSQSESTSKESALEFAKNIVTNSPALKKRIDKLQYSLRYRDGDSVNTLIILPQKEDRCEAIKPNMAIVDEIHTMKSGKIIEILRKGMRTQHNPLLSIISTRGENTTYFQYELEQSYDRILDGKVSSETTFVMMFEQDDETEAADPNLWVKSNPCIGNGSLELEDLIDDFETSKQTPSSLKSFFCKTLNMWVETKEEVFLEPEFVNMAFQKGRDMNLNLDFFKNKDVYIGMDLSRTDDLSSLCVTHFDPEKRLFYVMPFIYMANRPVKRIRGRGVDLTQWIIDGKICQSEINRIDYNDIINDLLKINSIANIKGIGHDGRFENEVVPYMEKLKNLEGYWLECVFVSQGIYDITPAVQLLDRIFAQGQVVCDDNPCFKWQFKNCVTYRGENNNIKISKKKSLDSIDSVIAFQNSLELIRREIKDSYYQIEYVPISIKF